MRDFSAILFHPPPPPTDDELAVCYVNKSAYLLYGCGPLGTLWNKYSTLSRQWDKHSVDRQLFTIIIMR